MFEQELADLRDLGEVFEQVGRDLELGTQLALPMADALAERLGVVTPGSLQRDADHLAELLVQAQANLENLPDYLEALSRMSQKLGVLNAQQPSQLLTHWP